MIGLAVLVVAASALLSISHLRPLFDSSVQPGGLLGAIVAESLADPEIRKFYRDSALTTLDSGADEMMKVIREQRAKWPEVIKAANIKLME